MFDKEKSGLIDVSDLQTIMRSLGRDPQEAVELLQQLEIDPNGKLSFEEFLRIMKNLENRLIASKNAEHNIDGGSPREASLEERLKYGSLLPRTGVHFLPDSKVIDFLKLLNDYRKTCIGQMNLAEAIRAQLKFDDLKNKETLRQMQNMRQAQESELVTVENAQRSQFLEFSQAWDNYMSDYEATAYLSLEKLKEKHLLEIQQLHEKIKREFKVKLKFTKELMEQRKQIQTLISLKRYEEAEILKSQCDQREEEEKIMMETELEEIISKQEERLRSKQQMALGALLKRIQRDRNEQLKHRQIDSQRLIQRNKNLLLDLLNKQNMETRRTNQFLKFALGARSPDRKKYFRSKLFTAAEDIKLKVGGSEMKNQINNPNNSSFAAIKAQQSKARARTSKGQDPRSMSVEIIQNEPTSALNQGHKTAVGGNFRSIQKNTTQYSNHRKSQDGSAMNMASTTAGTGVIGAKLREEQLRNIKIQKSDVKLPQINK